MRKYLVIFRHMGKNLSRVIEANTRTNAMLCVSGVIISCKQCD